MCFRRRVTQTGKGPGDGLAKKMTKDFSIKSFFARPSRYNEHYGAEQKKGFSFLDAKHCGCHHSAHYIKLRAAAADCNQLLMTGLWLFFLIGCIFLPIVFASGQKTNDN